METVTNWLWESSQPAIHYRAMTELSGISEEDAEAKKVYSTIWETKEVQKMLEHQNAAGVWEHSEKEYGVHTSLRYLTACAEYGLHLDERLDCAVDYAVDFLNEKETADLNHDYSGCSNALVLRALVMLGYHLDGRVKRLLEQYAPAQVSDGGFICRRLLAKKPSRRACYKASLAALLLFAECQRKQLQMPGADRLVAYFTKRDVFFDSASKTKLLLDGNAGWRGIDNFFPVETMRIGLAPTMAALAVLGAGDHSGLNRAWALLEAKRNEAGRYALEGTLTKQPCKFGKVGEENKWVTLYAQLAEKYRHSLGPGTESV